MGAHPPLPPAPVGKKHSRIGKEWLPTKRPKPISPSAHQPVATRCERWRFAGAKGHQVSEPGETHSSGCVWSPNTSVSSVEMAFSVGSVSFQANTQRLWFRGGRISRLLSLCLLSLCLLSL